MFSLYLFRVLSPPNFQTLELPLLQLCQVTVLKSFLQIMTIVSYYQMIYCLHTLLHNTVRSHVHNMKLFSVKSVHAVRTVHASSITLILNATALSHTQQTLLITYLNFILFLALKITTDVGDLITSYGPHSRLRFTINGFALYNH